MTLRFKKPLIKAPTEELEQIRFATWLDKSDIAYFAIPNGGHRNLYEAVKLKRGGVKSGVPDIFIPIASGTYFGLFVELKRKQGGKVSDNQRFWIDRLQKNGYYVSIAYGFDEAKIVVLNYLALTPKAC